MTTEEDIQELAEKLEEQGISRKELLKRVSKAVVLGGRSTDTIGPSTDPVPVREFRLSTDHAEEIYIEHEGIDYRVNQTDHGLELVQEKNR